MTFSAKLKEAVLSRAVESGVAAIVVLLAWAVSEIYPVLFPAIEAATTKKLLLSLLVLSAILNLIFLAFIWLLSKNDSFKLKYGIYWDKQLNPHCPTCKTPLVTRSIARVLENEFFCNSCKSIVNPHNENLQTISRQKSLELIKNP